MVNGEPSTVMSLLFLSHFWKTFYVTLTSEPMTL